MNVYLLMHDEGIDVGESVRAVYLTEAAANAALTTRTASGRPSRAWTAHSDLCCRVDECEVMDAPEIDIREDDPPMTGPGIIPDSLRESILEVATRPNPYRNFRG